MKIKTTLFLLLATLSLNAQSQIIETTITSNDTIVYARCGPFSLKQYSGKSAIKYVNEQKKSGNRWQWDAGHWSGIGIMYNGLVENLGNLYKPQDAMWMTQSTESIGVDLNLVDVTLFSSGCFGIVTGLGFEFNNFRFDQNVTLGNDENGYVVPDWSYRDAGIELSKTKLTTSYLQIPLLFEFQFGHKRRTWINAGVVGGLLIDAHTKVMWGENGKEKRYRGLNLNNFHYGFEVAFGHGIFGLRAKYYPQSIFRPGQGPQVQQVNIGLAISF